MLLLFFNLRTLSLLILLASVCDVSLRSLKLETSTIHFGADIKALHSRGTMPMNSSRTSARCRNRFSWSGLFKSATTPSQSAYEGYDKWWSTSPVAALSQGSTSLIDSFAVTHLSRPVSLEA
jgi:hypothetical protein